MSIDFTLRKEDVADHCANRPDCNGFTLYWFVAHSKRFEKHYYSKYDFDEATEKHIFFRKVVGFVSMGIVPIATCLILLDLPLSDYGFTFIRDTTLFTIAGRSD